MNKVRNSLNSVVISSLLLGVSPIILILPMVKILGYEVYGIYGAAIFFFTMVTATSGLGLSAFFFKNLKEYSLQDVSLYIQLTILVSVMMAIVSLICFSMFSLIIKQEIFGFFDAVIIVVAGTLNHFFRLLIQYQQYLQDNIAFLKTTIVFCLIQILATLGLLMIDIGMVSRFWGISLAATLVIIWSARKYTFKLVTLDFDNCIKEVRKSIYFVPHNLGGILFSSVDRLVILHFFGNEISGRYFLTTQIIGAFRFLEEGFSKYWNSRYFNITSKDKKNLFLILVVLIVLGVLGLIGLLVVDFLTVKILFTGFPNYLACILLLGIGMLLQGISKLYVIRYVRDNEASALAHRTIFVGLTNVALCFSLAPLYGIIGVAAAFAISASLLLTLSFTKSICD